jgi:hypothetical protein
MKILVLSIDLRVPLQVTCRGAPRGYPRSTISNSQYVLVQDVSIPSSDLRDRVFRSDWEGVGARVGDFGASRRVGDFRGRGVWLRGACARQNETLVGYA